MSNLYSICARAQPAEHWIHLRTANPIESAFATVRLRTRITKGPGSRAAGVAMAVKLIESAQARWRAVNDPTWSPWSAPARRSRTANSSNDPTNQEVISEPRNQGGHETGRHVGQRELPGQVCLLDGGMHGRTQTCRVGR
jgi:hypothetical protein